MELVSIHYDQEKTGFDEFLERNSYTKGTFKLVKTSSASKILVNQSEVHTNKLSFILFFFFENKK